MSASSSSTSASESRTPVTVEQVIGEAFVRSAQTILTSRIYTPQQPRNGHIRRSTWFKLELEELEAASADLDRWRKDPGLPLIVEIYLQPWAAPGTGNNDTTNAAMLEQWVIHYKPSLPDTAVAASGLTRNQLNRLSPQSVYKRLTIMLRSLFSYVRILPAYRLYRTCQRQSTTASFSLTYKLHSTLPRRATAAVSLPGSSGGSRRMQHFDFSPVDTAYGQLRLSVDYQPSTTINVLEQTTAPLALPRIISDYVGGQHSQKRLPLRSVASALPSTTTAVTEAPSLPTHAFLPGNTPTTPAGIAHEDAASTTSTATTTPVGTPRRQSWSSGGAVWGRLQATAALGSAREGSSPGVSELGGTLQTGAHIPRLLSTPMQNISPSPSSPMTTTASGRGKPHLHPLPSPPTTAPSPLSMYTTTGTNEVISTIQSPPPVVTTAATPTIVSVTTSSAPRQISAPMSIPGSSDTTHLYHHTGRDSRKLRSSGDLGALGIQASNVRPLSAPSAVSHLQQGRHHVASAGNITNGGGTPSSKDRDVRSNERVVVAERYHHIEANQGNRSVDSRGSSSGATSGIVDEALLPPEPLPPITTASYGDSDSGLGSSAASIAALFPASCSPDLPFAFTPRTTDTNISRLNSLPPSSHFHNNNDTTARPLHTRNDSGTVNNESLSSSLSTSTSLALVRRPSGGGIMSNSLGGMGSVRIGYSVSPIQDPSCMDSMLQLSSSTPRHMYAQQPFLSGRLASLPQSGALAMAQSGGNNSGVGPRLLTFPSDTAGGNDVDGDDVCTEQQQQVKGPTTRNTRRVSFVTSQQHHQEQQQQQLENTETDTSADMSSSPFELAVKNSATDTVSTTTADDNTMTRDASGATTATATEAFYINTTTSDAEGLMVTGLESAAVEMKNVDGSDNLPNITIGAFVRLLQEAAPSSVERGGAGRGDSRGVSLESGLAQLESIRQRMNARGVA